MQVEIYSKPDCSLCDEAKEVIRRVQKRVRFEWREVNIETDPELFERFRYDIPVIFIDGQKAFKHRIDEKNFEARLKR
jgi:glutaredoxin